MSDDRLPLVRRRHHPTRPRPHAAPPNLAVHRAGAVPVMSRIPDCRYTVRRVREAPVPLWAAIPNQRWLDGSHQKALPGTGRRVVEAPEGSMATATWQEAMDFVTAGKWPRPIAEVYPEFCGVGT